MLFVEKIIRKLEKLVQGYSVRQEKFINLKEKNRRKWSEIGMSNEILD